MQTSIIGSDNAEIVLCLHEVTRLLKYRCTAIAAKGQTGKFEDSQQQQAKGSEGTRSGIRRQSAKAGSSFHR